MFKRLNLLSDVQVRTAKPGANLNDGGGLFLRVSPAGGKTWTFRYTAPAGERAGKQRELGLGVYPLVSLVAARAGAADARAAVARGVDPVSDRQGRTRAARDKAEADAKAWTLGRYADDVFVPHAIKGLANKASVQAWRTTFATYLAPLRDKRLAEIARKDVLDVLAPLWAEKEVTASRVRERLERLFSHAAQNGHVSGDNPAAWRQFDQTLKRSGAMTRGHHASVATDDAPAVMAAIRSRQGDTMGVLLLEFIALSACRTTEAREAVWSEFDLTRGRWTIPAVRMKMGRAHVVPLTPRMVELLGLAKARRPANLPPAGPADLVFPAAAGGKPLSINTARQLLQEITKGDQPKGTATPHGWRATFKTWANNSTEFPRELIEEALAHQVGGVEGAYLRDSAVERRRALMEAWEAHLAGKAPAGANVVPLRAAAGA